MTNSVLILSFLFGLFMQFTALYSIRTKRAIAHLASYTAVLFLSFCATIALLFYFGLPGVCLAVFCAFSILNCARLLKGRMNVLELQAKYGRTLVWMTIFSTVSIVLALFTAEIDYFMIMLVSALGISSLLMLQTIYSAVTWRPKLRQLEARSATPTVSICIPARNETQDLPECIESILQSTYSKLEILVLDDCSHDKTPEIIKEYAHQGVRFISGTEPSSDWLAKNQAMNKLFDESNGEILIFAGVDVRFEPITVQKIVGLMEHNEMIGVLPRRSLSHELSVFIQPLRYWWELSLPRIFGGRPPVLSTCWAIRKKSLNKLGEFDSFRKSVQPEAHFAKRLKHTYSFIISGNRLGITSVKPPRDQYDTAIRTRYPQLKRRMELVPVLLITELVVFFSPLIGLVYSLASTDTQYLVPSLMSVCLLILINTYIGFLTVYRTWLLSLVTLPFLLLEEWFIVIRSMLAYEFGSVTWKDRNICLPMYKVEKTLPKLD